MQQGVPKAARPCLGSHDFEWFWVFLSLWEVSSFLCSRFTCLIKSPAHSKHGWLCACRGGWWREKDEGREASKREMRGWDLGFQKEGEMDRSPALLPQPGFLKMLFLTTNLLFPWVISSGLSCPFTDRSQLISSLNDPWGSHGKFLESRNHICILISCQCTLRGRARKRYCRDSRWCLMTEEPGWHQGTVFALRNINNCWDISGMKAQPLVPYGVCVYSWVWPSKHNISLIYSMLCSGLQTQENPFESNILRLPCSFSN